MSDENFGSVTLSEIGPVALIVFSRPPSNFFDFEVIRDLATAFEAVDVRPHLRASVLASEGKTFCAGADLRAGDPNSTAVYPEALRIYAVRKPIVAAIQGAAIGGGMGWRWRPIFASSRPKAGFP